MAARRVLTLNDLRGQPGLSRTARDQVLRQQPTTVLQALRIHGVGRRTTQRLRALGLLTDPEHVQARALSVDECAGQALERRPLHRRGGRQARS